MLASGTGSGITTMPIGPFNPEEMKELLIVAPVVALYSPIVLLPIFVTKRFPPDSAMAGGAVNPEEMKELLMVAPVEALYSPIVLLFWFVTKRFPPDSAMPNGPLNPEEMKELLIVAPVVALYSPIVLVFAFVTKIWPRLVTGMTHSAADAAKPERINRIFTRVLFTCCATAAILTKSAYECQEFQLFLYL